MNPEPQVTIEKEADDSIDEVKRQDEEPVNKKERRRPVRRKSKPDEKLIDENSLQNNLLDEFTGE